MTYGASPVSPVKRRRRTSAQLDAIDDAIVIAVEADKPVTLRGVYYRVASAGGVDKTERGYDLIGRELLKLRRDGRVSYADITDGTPVGTQAAVMGRPGLDARGRGGILPTDAVARPGR